MAEGTHAYPSRTRPLRPPAPMILGVQTPGKVGRRQASDKGSSVQKMRWAFLHLWGCEWGDLGKNSCRNGPYTRMDQNHC